MAPSQVDRGTCRRRNQKKWVLLQTVGIEPTLLRTRALSVRLNRSAKTAILQVSPIHDVHVVSENDRYDFMAQWQRVGFQTRRLGVRFPLRSSTFFGSTTQPLTTFFPLPSPHPRRHKQIGLRVKIFPRRDLNPGLVGENHIS